MIFRRKKLFQLYPNKIVNIDNINGIFYSEKNQTTTIYFNNKEADLIWISDEEAPTLAKDVYDRMLRILPIKRLY